MVWLAGITLLLTLAMGIEAIDGLRRLGRLAACPPLEGPGPKVSVIVAVRDEARNVEAGVRSMLAQAYPDLEVVAVNDRSTDATGAILDRLAAADPRLRVGHVTELPDGWLGKTHAMAIGAERASGDWLLFADGDVKMTPDAVARAIGYAEAHQVDHLAVAPDLVMPGRVLGAFTAHFLLSFMSFTKPWKVRDGKSSSFVGVGAFNLVRRSAYQAVGGHKPVALRPDDDMKLGKIIKGAGYRQDCLVGSGVLSVEWYHSVGEMIRGLEKNMFAGVDYQIWLSLLGGFLQLLYGIVPLAAVWLTGGLSQAFWALQIAVVLLIYARLAKEVRQPATIALLYPVVVLLFVYILWRTMVLNLVQGGLQWRGTFYPLAKLKANRV